MVSRRHQLLSGPLYTPEKLPWTHITDPLGTTARWGGGGRGGFCHRGSGSAESHRSAQLVTALLKSSQSNFIAASPVCACSHLVPSLLSGEESSCGIFLFILVARQSFRSEQE